VVEDNKADVFLIRSAIKTAHIDADLEVVHDGENALRFLDQVERGEGGACPALIILDINLPKKSGAEVLKQMRTMRRCADIPVMVVTSSDSAQDRTRMAELGIDAYFRKPSGYDEFMKVGELVRQLLGGASNPGANA
jgi:DNA-binding response OmpR family regulator